jgi:hypothetical protein
MLKTSNHIENLSFMMDYISPIDLQLFGEALAVNERLKNLVLGKFSISNDSMADIVRGLASNSVKPVQSIAFHGN